MSDDNKHWTNQVKVICEMNCADLVKALNEFYRDRFVIATQIWSPVQSGDQTWEAIVYYKVPPESK